MCQCCCWHSSCQPAPLAHGIGQNHSFLSAVNHTDINTWTTGIIMRTHKFRQCAFAVIYPHRIHTLTETLNLVFEHYPFSVQSQQSTFLIKRAFRNYPHPYSPASSTNLSEFSHSHRSTLSIKLVCTEHTNSQGHYLLNSKGAWMLFKYNINSTCTPIPPHSQPLLVELPMQNWTQPSGNTHY